MTMRYFKVKQKGASGGTLSVNKGIPIRDEVTGKLEWLNAKKVSLDALGILKTDDPEVIYYVFNPKTESFIDPHRPGVINELFIGESKWDNMMVQELMPSQVTYSEMYGFKTPESIREHTEKVKEAIKNKEYFYTPKKDYQSLLISLQAQEQINKVKEMELNIKEKEIQMKNKELYIKANEIISENEGKSYKEVVAELRKNGIPQFTIDLIKEERSKK